MASFKCAICGMEFFTVDALMIHMVAEHPSPKGISNRIASTIERWSQSWKGRLGNWFAEFIAWGLEIILNIIGKAAAPKLKPLIDAMEATGKVPPELQPILDEIKSPTGQISAIFASSAGYALVGGAIGKLLDSILLPMAYAVSSVTKNVIITEPQLLASWLREDMTEEQLIEFLHWLGHEDVDIEWLKKLTTIRLDPGTITRIWLRDRAKYEKWWKDLEHQGWDKDRIDVAKELARIIPPLADMVRFADFSAFDVDVIRKWAAFYPAPSEVAEAFKLIGIENKAPEDIEEIQNWANKYWFSHYVQPGRFELGEMYRRGLLGKPLVAEPVQGEAEDTIKLAYKTMAYSDFWQDKLLQLVRAVPTRVDVRRFWDMGTIGVDRLKEIYQALGYFGTDLDDYVLWTKVYTLFPDLVARVKNGWINEVDAKLELEATGLKEPRLSELWETKFKAVLPERTAGERELTKSDIYKGIKADRITREEGIDLLLDLGFDEDEATLLLDTNVPVDVTDKVVKERELTKADILKGLKTAVITRDEARTRLLELRYSPADAEFLLKIYDAQVKPPEEPREREASKADIVLAVKKDLITPEDAYLMLQDIHFTPEASQFILSVRAEVSAFSPINYAEFKERTQKYRVAAGMEVKPMPEELKKAAEEVVRLTGEVEALERSIVEEERGLVDEEILPAAATARRDELRVSLHRAEAELARVKSDYASKLAEWRHGPTE